MSLSVGTSGLIVFHTGLPAEIQFMMDMWLLKRNREKKKQ